MTQPPSTQRQTLPYSSGVPSANEYTSIPLRRVACDMHFDAEDLDAMKSHMDEEVFGDMADNLIARFGGRSRVMSVEVV
jgi:hypothetical protein